MTKHHLLIAIRRILQEDTNTIRDKDFKEIANRKPIINFVYKLHGKLKPSYISALMIACYGLKSLLALSIKKKASELILFSYAFPNEKITGEFIEKCIGKNKVSEVKHSNLLLLASKNVLILVTSLTKIKSIKKYLNVIYKINKDYDFMPACRTASTICFYIRFKHELRKNNFKAILVSKNYSPDCIALVWSAKSLKISTIFCSHTFIPPVKLQKPPLSFSLLLLQGEKMYQIFKARGQVDGKVIYKGIDATYYPLKLDALKQSGMRVGIFLSGNMNISGISDQIKAINNQLNASTILIRFHPVALTNANIDSFKEQYKNLEYTFGTELKDDLDKCDLVVVGNSGVTLQVLKMGAPCVYASDLEFIEYDYNGFVSEKIVPDWKAGSRIEIDKIKEFYNENWNARFNKYDPLYGLNQSVEEQVRIEIENLLKPV